MTVIDASVVLTFVLADEDPSTWDDLVRTMSDVGAVAPTIWGYEVASGIAAAQRRGRLTEDQATATLDLVTSLPMEFVHPQPDELVRISRDTGLSVYDASYLAVCRTHDLPLASFDQRLRRAATELGIDLL